MLALICHLLLASPASAADSLQSVVKTNGLTLMSYNFSVPNQVMGAGDAYSYVQSNWNMNGNKVDFGASDLAFSADPSTTSNTLVRRASKSSSATSTVSGPTPSDTNLAGEPPVFRVNYPQGSYSKSTGGTQFYSPLQNATGSTGYGRMLLSYDVWFPSGFGWNMGGKLPGLRGGPDPRGCSGGTQTDGTTCFSTRLMWRAGGSGEVYAYIPTDDLPDQSNIINNSDYGTSLARGSFSFTTGQWQTIWLFVALNDVGSSNGVVQLWYNGVQALSFTNLQLRTASSLASVGGLYFSTFFGGDDSTWATPTNQYTYFRNMQLYGGNGTSSASPAVATTGSAGSASTSAKSSAVRVLSGNAGWGLSLGLVGMVLGAGLLGLGL